MKFTLSWLKEHLETDATLAPDSPLHQGMSDETLLRQLLEQHLAATGSEIARNVLSDWARYRARFVKVFPNEYRRALQEMAAAAMKEVA